MNSKASKPKLLIVLSRFPYPLEKGDKLRAYYQIRALSVHYRIFLFCLSEENVNQSQVDHISDYCEKIIWEKLTKRGIYFRLILNSFGSLPFQVAYFNSASAKSKLMQLVDIIQPDHIYCQLIRTTELIKNYHVCPKTLDFMDALSIGMERRASRVKGIMKMLFREEAKRLREYERRIFNYFENHLIISKQDLYHISHPEQKNIVVVPNGIDEYFFEKNTVAKEYDLVFVGNLSYAPNIEAATFLIKELLPRLPNRNLLLAGATPTSEILKLAKENKNVFVSGWTEDIRDSYRKGRIFIAPMFIGTGMQNKLLEAMALGTPCITTSLANNAIQAENKVHLLVADNINNMTEAIENLEKDETLKEHLIEHARKFVKENYTWEKSAKQIHALISGQTAE
jgi:glycosyltransferase involved in cell wall biosynthesis